MSDVVRPPKPWLAVLLAMVSPGLGLLYTGRPVAAVLFATTPAAVLTLSLGTVALSVPRLLVPVLFTCMVLWFLTWLFQGAWSWVGARRPASNPMRWWFLALFGMASCVITRGEALALRTFVIEPFAVSGAGMEPTLLRGDNVFVVKLGPAATLQRGSIVVARFPDMGLPSLKRVLALPGERVGMSEGLVELDDVPVPTTPCPNESACLIEAPIGTPGWRVRPGGPPIERQRLGAERLYLMGDNRPNSSDSRDLGTVPKENVIGRAVVVWSSWGDGRIRWERFGL